MSSSDTPFGILYEDNHLLVVDKPAGLASMGTAEGTPSLHRAASEYIRHKYAKPGNVYLGIVSRLDAPVTGAMVIARTSKAASRLTEAFRQHKVEKIYLALVEGTMLDQKGKLVHYLRHDERNRRVHTTSANASGAREAVLTYRTLACWEDCSLCEVRLQTGRKHQIRVQLAKIGHPLWGDRKYGAAQPFPRGVALHAWRLSFEHPVLRQPLQFEAPIPPYWPSKVHQQLRNLGPP